MVSLGRSPLVPRSQQHLPPPPSFVAALLSLFLLSRPLGAGMGERACSRHGYHPGESDCHQILNPLREENDFIQEVVERWLHGGLYHTVGMYYLCLWEVTSQVPDSPHRSMVLNCLLPRFLVFTTSHGSALATLQHGF